MTRTSTMSRRQLLDVLQSISSTSGLQSPSELSLPFEADRDSVRVVWDAGQEESPVPAVIVIERDKQRDFFAWVTTFVPSLRPFSAFCRVVDSDMVKILLDRHSRAFSSKLTGAWIGMTVSEAFLWRALRRRSTRLTMRDCFGTASFSLSRALRMGLSGKIKHIVDDWAIAKELVEQTSVPYLDEILHVWQIVESLSDPSTDVNLTREQQAIRLCCQDVMESGAISEEAWGMLTGRIRDLHDTKTLMNGTREERVIALERVFPVIIRSTEVGKPIKAFTCGYLTSSVAPGTLDHMVLLNQIIQTLPGSALWYGFLAGLRGSEGVQSYANGTGRRVMREVLRQATLTDTPTCDIALAELVVLADTTRIVPDWLRDNSPFLDVELAPGVTCSLRCSDPERDTSEGWRSAQANELRNLLLRIEDISFRLDDVRRDVLRLTGRQPAQNTQRESRGRGRKYP